MTTPDTPTPSQDAVALHPRAGALIARERIRTIPIPWPGWPPRCRKMPMGPMRGW